MSKPRKKWTPLYPRSPVDHTGYGMEEAACNLPEHVLQALERPFNDLHPPTRTDDPVHTYQTYAEATDEDD